MNGYTFATRPETPYHLHGTVSKVTSAACGVLDDGDILSPADFEGLLDRSPSWCCKNCAKKYQDFVDEIVKARIL